MRYLMVLLAFGFSCCDAGQITDSSVIDAIVNKHNTFRRGVSPAAHPKAPIPDLTWDADLAAAAAKDLATCAQAMAHQNSGYGENLGANSPATTVAADAEGVIAMWDSEKKDYNLDENSCSATTCQHYTQVVWDQTTKVGCATIAGCSFDFTMHCYYDPAGNMNGNKPYVPDTAKVPTAPTTGISKDDTHLILTFTEGLGSAGEHNNVGKINFYFKFDKDGMTWSGSGWKSVSTSSSPYKMPLSDFRDDVYKFEFTVTVGDQESVATLEI